ncbi:hypothetical protein AAER26_07620, partial [Pseudomonas aeruginosa]
NSDKLNATYDWQSFIKYVDEIDGWKAYDLWQVFDSLSQLYDITQYITSISYIDCNSYVIPAHHVQTPSPISYHQDSMPVYRRADYENT